MNKSNLLPVCNSFYLTTISAALRRTPHQTPHFNCGRAGMWEAVLPYYSDVVIFKLKQTNNNNNNNSNNKKSPILLLFQLHQI